MEIIKKGDFIEIEYKVFQEDNNMLIDKSKEPAVIRVGKKMVPEEIDNYLVGKEIGKEYDIVLPPEKAFGERKEELIKIIPLSYVKKFRINPKPGMVLNVDGMIGIVRSVSGGRVIVDFNHPLAGKSIKYIIKVNRIVEDPKEVVKGVLYYFYDIPREKINVEIDEGKLKIKIDLDLDDSSKERIREFLENIIDKKYEIELI